MTSPSALLSTDETESAKVAQFLRLTLAADNVDSTIIAKEILVLEAATQKVEEGDMHKNNTTEEVPVAMV